MRTRTGRALPKLDPIALVAGRPPLCDPAWMYEPKFDGLRGVLYLTRLTCHLRSERGTPLHRFAELCERVRTQLHARDAILDGEVVALDEEGRQNPRALLEGHGWLHYAAFDLLWLNGRDFSRESLTVRKRRLEQLIPQNNPTLSRVLTVDADGRELFEAVQRLDLAGIVAKRKADPYAPGTAWFTIRNPSYSQGEGRWQLFQRPR